MAIAIAPTILKLNHSKFGRFCPDFKWFLSKCGNLSGFQMVGLPNFRSHSKSGPFETKPLINHSQSRLVLISDHHCSLIFQIPTVVVYAICNMNAYFFDARAWLRESCEKKKVERKLRIRYFFVMLERAEMHGWSWFGPLPHLSQRSLSHSSSRPQLNLVQRTEKSVEVGIAQWIPQSRRFSKSFLVSF